MPTFSSMPIISPGGLTASSTAAKNKLGTVAEDVNGYKYRYVQNISADSIAIANGTCVYLASVSAWVVSPDYTGGSSTSTRVAGVGIGAIAAGSYGWIQITGIHTAVKTDAGVAAADYLVGHSVDGECDTMGDGEEEQVFGAALEADTATEPHSAACILFGCI